MNSRKLAGASAASVGAATAVAALLLGTVPGSAGENFEDFSASAFGLAADGLLPIAPTPFVKAPPGGDKALLEVPGPNRNGIYVALLKVEAERFHSKATALKVDILGLKLKVLEATCDNGRGESSIIKTDNGDKSSPYSGQELDLSPVVTVEFNRQHRDRDLLTVDAAVISLLPSDKLRQTITEKDLALFRGLAPQQVKVPTMEQVREAKAKSDAPAGSPLTVGDLVSSIKVLNPTLLSPKDGRDALLEIVISSASCREERREDRKEEAPKPKPVEADLPVTH